MTTENISNPLAAWHLRDVAGNTYPPAGHGYPLSVGGVAQALSLFPLARSIVAETGEALLYIESMFRAKLLPAALLNCPSVPAQISAARLFDEGHAE